MGVGCVGSHEVGSARLRYESQLLNAKATCELKTRDALNLFQSRKALMSRQY